MRRKTWTNPDAECQYDCVHLKACRRLQKIAKKKYGEHVARHCDGDCTAYQTLSDVIATAPRSELSAQELWELSDPDMYDAVMAHADNVFILDDRP